MEQRHHALTRNAIIAILCLLFMFPLGVVVSWLITSWPIWVKMTLTLVLMAAIVVTMIHIGVLLDLQSDKRLGADVNPEHATMNRAPILRERYRSARDKELDSKRKFDLRNVQSALERYKARNDVYPAVLADLTPQYLTIVPSDPVSKNPYKYRPLNGSNAYMLTATLSTGEEYSVSESKSN
jgi:hypothetical protein